MKRAQVLSLSLAVCALQILFAGPAGAAREDGYDKLARELSAVANVIPQPKVAILSFNYIDQRESDSGVIIAERLTTRMVKINKCKIIERQLLEKVLKELHLENSGVVDAETTKQLGKVLGVEAIITGTLMDVEDGNIEVNARVIKAETAEVITTSSVEIKKTWADITQSAPAAPQSSFPFVGTIPQTATVTQGTYSETPGGVSKPVMRAKPPMKFDSYVDLFFGMPGSGTASIFFSNTSPEIDAAHVGLPLISDNHKKVDIKDLKTDDGSMIGGRLLGFGKHWGGDLEISYKSHQVKGGQVAKVTADGVSQTITIPAGEYLRVNSFAIAGDVLYRFMNKKIQPYVGMGMGMTINGVNSSSIWSFDGTVWDDTLSEMALGFQFRIPMGVRVEVGKKTHAFLEYRPTIDTNWFIRNVEDESDKAVISSGQLLLGVGFKM